MNQRESPLTAAVRLPAGHKEQRLELPARILPGGRKSLQHQAALCSPAIPCAPSAGTKRWGKVLGAGSRPQAALRQRFARHRASLPGWAQPHLRLHPHQARILPGTAPVLVGCQGWGRPGPPPGNKDIWDQTPPTFSSSFFFFFFLDLDLCRVNICDLCNRHFLPGGQDAAPDKYYFFCLTGCFVSPLPNAHCRGRHPCFANAQAALVPFWSCICYSPPLLFRWSPCLQPGVSSVCAKSVQCWLCEVNYCRTPRTFSAGVANLQSTENKGGARRLHPHCACLQKDARASADKPLAVSGHF